MYSFSDAARLAGVSTSTVKNWLFGYTIRDHQVPPLFPSGDSTMVSFLQMIEIMVAGRFRRSGSGSKSISFRKVRVAYTNAQQMWNLKHPFAHLKLEVIGGHIVNFLEHGSPEDSFQALDAPEQWTMPGTLQDTIAQIDYIQDLAARWFPVGRDIPIVVDPKISAGLPVIEGRGVTVQAISDQHVAGLDIEFIADDFEIPPSSVRTALEYWEKVAA